MKQFEIKRKFFDVIEQMGERSYKVSRKDELYFLKDFGKDEDGFENFVERTNDLKITGVKQPKVYMYDKNSHIIVMEFIEGENVAQMLSEHDLDEIVIQKLFNTFWYAKTDKLSLEYRPDNFRWYKDNLYYIPFKIKKFINNDKFIQEDIFYWFPTKKCEEYLSSAGFSFDHSRIKNDFETNKMITLLSIKYYR